MSDIEAIVARHSPRPSDTRADSEVCRTCWVALPASGTELSSTLYLMHAPWPCDARVLADALAATEADADALARMLNEACWAIDHTCAQCGDTQPSHTPRCPTSLALAAHDARRQG